MTVNQDTSLIKKTMSSLGRKKFLSSESPEIDSRRHEIHSKGGEAPQMIVEEMKEFSMTINEDEKRDSNGITFT